MKPEIPSKRSLPPKTSELAQAISALARSAGDYPTVIPGLSLHRRHGPTAPLHCVFSLGLGVVAQGHKQALLRTDVICYGPGQSMLTTIDLPVISHVTQASDLEPLLGLMLTLDPREVGRLAAELELPPLRDTVCRSITVESLDRATTDALTRLVHLLEEPGLTSRLAPLIVEEIMIRLLSGPHAQQLRRLAADGSPSAQIAKAVTWLKMNFAQPLLVDDLAAQVGMSPSTFRQHFRVITRTSPLQYQKTLRLQEARQLMLSENIDAGNASGLVGYESPSQFSREYSRLFGAPPQQDVRRLREH